MLLILPRSNDYIKSKELFLIKYISSILTIEYKGYNKVI